MFKTRQFKLAVSVLVIALAMFFGIYTLNSVLVAGLISLASIYLFIHSQLVSKKPRDIVLKMLRVAMWLGLGIGYSDVMVRIFGYSLAYILPGIIITILGVAVICWHELSSERSQAVEHGISMSLIWLGLSWASLVLAYYHWPVALILPIVWIGQFLIALWWAASLGQKAEFLAAVWAVVVVELVWVGSRWVSLYQLPKLGLVLSQSSVLALSMGYSLGGLYFHRQNKKLTKPLVFEYFAITAIVVILVIIMTKWSNTP